MEAIGISFYKRVFILRFWQEPRGSETSTPELRGVIEDVPSGERRYVRDIGQVCDILNSALQELVPGPQRVNRLKRIRNAVFRIFHVE